MNACERVETLLSAYIDREASPSEARFIEGHLTICPACRRQVDDLTRLVNRLHFLPRVEPSADFTARVLDAALGRPAAGLEEPVFPALRSRTRTWAPALAAAAALVVVGALTVSRLPVGSPKPATPEVAALPALPAGSTVSDASTAVPTPPAEGIQVRRLDEEIPGLADAGSGGGEEGGTSLGTVQYVLEDWTTRAPSGGGDPVLTRVRGDVGESVVVTF